MRLEEKWHAATDGFCVDAYCDGELAFALSLDDGVFAWNVEYDEPEALWDRELDVLAGATERHWLALQSHVVLVEEPARNTIVTAIEPYSGEVDWRRQFDARFGCIVEAGYRLYLFCEGFCEILDLRDGSVIQQVGIEPLCERAFRVGRRVFAASETTLLEMSMPEDAKAEVLERESGNMRGLFAGRAGVVALDGEDVLKGRTHEDPDWWQFAAPEREIVDDGSSYTEPADLGNPIIDDKLGNVLVCDLNGSLHCVDLAFGDHQWTAFGEKVPSAMMPASPAVMDEYVAFPCSDETLYLVEYDSGVIVDAVEMPGPVEGCVRYTEETLIVPIDGLRAYRLVD